VSGGRGLGGLRERVGMLGGEFTAGPRPGGGFVVRAAIPTEGAS
jgi:signal transduction histidine kinase